MTKDLINMSTKLNEEMVKAKVESEEVQKKIMTTYNAIREICGEEPDDILVCTKRGDNNILTCNSVWFAKDSILYEVKKEGNYLNFDRIKLNLILYLEVKTDIIDFDKIEPHNELSIYARFNEASLSGVLTSQGLYTKRTIEFYKKHFQPAIQQTCL